MQKRGLVLLSKEASDSYCKPIKAMNRSQVIIHSFVSHQANPRLSVVFSTANH